jgi:hypothetical protein
MLWQIENLDYPIDFQILSGDRILIAEYYGSRVTERDLAGKILWQVPVPSSPINVQRLANGNTFIALFAAMGATGAYSLMEVEKQGKTVASFSGNGFPERGNTRGAYKLADGRMVCIGGKGACIWLDSTGKEIKEFAVGPFLTGVNAPYVMGNVDVTPKGHVLVAGANDTIVEYDPKGKMVWQAKAAGNRATRLNNSHTLVASEKAGVFELDLQGNTVWKYQPPPGYSAVRARLADHLTPTARRVGPP